MSPAILKFSTLEAGKFYIDVEEIFAKGNKACFLI